MKTLFFAILVAVSITTFAQQIPVTQHDWSKYEWVDTCSARYAVVYDWNGRCGIYNLEKHENITELEYRQLNFSRIMNLEGGNQATVFYGKKGIREGAVAVDPDDQVMELTQEDNEMFYSLGSCTTIDKSIEKFARKLLKDKLESKDNEGAMYGQILVMDTKTAQIKAWVAMKDEFGNGKFENARLQKNQCSMLPLKIIMATMAISDANLSLEDTVDTKFGTDSIGGLCIKDRNMQRGGYGRLSYRDAFKLHSNIAMAKAMYASDHFRFQQMWQRNYMARETDAMNIAALYNVVANGGIVYVPSVISDSVRLDCEEDFPNARQIKMAQDILRKTLQDGGIGSQWTTRKVDLSGDYTTYRNCPPTLYDDNAGDLDKFYSDEGMQSYSQVIFAGYLPSDTPQYTICVTMDSKHNEISGKNISSIVNELAEYLNKH